MAKFVVYGRVELAPRPSIGTAFASAEVEANTHNDAIKQVQEAGSLSYFNNYKLEDIEKAYEVSVDLEDLQASKLDE